MMVSADAFTDRYIPDGSRCSCPSARSRAMSSSWVPRPRAAASANHASGGRAGSWPNRASASTPMVSPVPRSTMGWKWVSRDRVVMIWRIRWPRCSWNRCAGVCLTGGRRVAGVRGYGAVRGRGVWGGMPCVRTAPTGPLMGVDMLVTRRSWDTRESPRCRAHDRRPPATGSHSHRQPVTGSSSTRTAVSGTASVGHRCRMPGNRCRQVPPAVGRVRAPR